MAPENIIGREVEKRETRPYRRSRQEESCRQLPSLSSWRSIEPERRRSANGSQAGTTEHSGFLPQHGAKGTAQYYDLSGQRGETDGSYPIVRQVLGGPRNQQPGAAHLQACDFDSRHFTRSPHPHRCEVGGGGVAGGRGDREFRSRHHRRMKGVCLRRDDSSLSSRDSSRNSSRNEPKAVLNPSEQRERAFLVGVEFRTKGRAGGGRKTNSATITPGAQAARDHARSVAASSSSSFLPADSPDFSSDFTSEESLDELRALATSAGAQIAGEFTQRRDRPEPATLIGKGKLEEIAGASASVSADVILFDHDLSPSQQRNIERVVHTRVIDRTQLILG